MHAVGAEGERRLDVVVDHERDAHCARGVADTAASLDDLGRAQALEAQLDHRRSTFGGALRDRCVLDDAVELHASEIRVRGSSASRVNAYSPSYRRAWNVPGPEAW